jgi:hypothetical protein
MTEMNAPPPGLIDQVTRAVADQDHPVELVDGQLQAEDIARIIVAYQTFLQGEPIGTVKMDPESNAVAMRVDDPNQGPCWRVTRPDGSQYTELQPTLADWTSVSA